MKLPNRFIKSKDLNNEVLSPGTQKLLSVLRAYGVEVKSAEEFCGPTVTRYELVIKPGLHIRDILDLKDELKMHMSKRYLRIECPVPGTNKLAIEFESDERKSVLLSELLDSEEYRDYNSPTKFIIGKDLNNQPVIGDFKRTPGILIAGATGTGKSELMHSIIISLINSGLTAEDMRLILIDTKVVEFYEYRERSEIIDTPITRADKAMCALKDLITEMTARYGLIADAGVRNIHAYNEKARDNDSLKKLPFIVMMIDEFADLMMIGDYEIESLLCKLAQLGPAAGIYFVIGTQRPSYDVMTGLIKANIGNAIAFRVSCEEDSRTIIGEAGAEELMGRGDMLCMFRYSAAPMRVQGAYNNALFNQ